MESKNSQLCTVDSGPGSVGRRQLIRGLALATVTPGTVWTTGRDGSAVALGNRAHILVHPKFKDRLTGLFTNILGSPDPMVLNVAGAAQPILVFRLPGGGSLSVEFTEDALEERQARRGAWLELRTKDPVALKKKVLEASVRQIRYPATSTFYFEAPAGQVLGIVAAS